MPCGSDEIGRKCACFGLARSVIEEMDVSGTGKTNYASPARASIRRRGPTGAIKKTLNGVFLYTAERVECEYHPLNGDPREQQKRP